MGLSHIDESGRARMVDVSDKEMTLREAYATGRVYMKTDTLKMIAQGSLPKGDVFSTARIAGITAAKHTWEMIPMCHQIPIDSIRVELEANWEKNCVNITSTVRCVWKTGVEMEALTAAAVAALTVYDMCKAVDKDMIVGDIMLIKKTGGKSGVYERMTEE